MKFANKLSCFVWEVKTNLKYDSVYLCVQLSVVAAIGFLGKTVFLFDVRVKSCLYVRVYQQDSHVFKVKVLNFATTF